jgi:hypothetical protein
MRNLRWAIAASVIAVLTPLGASAATVTITQSFTITLNPAVHFDGAHDLFGGTLFDQFNPALGTLDTIRASISGPAVLEAEFTFVALGLAVESGNRIGHTQGFESNGDINVDLNAFAPFTPTFASLVGTGTTTLYLSLLGTPGSFATSPEGLQGTISYAYTPSVVPESSTWALMSVGFAGLGLAGYHRARIGCASLASRT